MVSTGVASVNPCCWSHDQFKSVGQIRPRGEQRRDTVQHMLQSSLSVRRLQWCGRENYCFDPSWSVGTPSGYSPDTSGELKWPQDRTGLEPLDRLLAATPTWFNKDFENKNCSFYSLFFYCDHVCLLRTLDHPVVSTSVSPFLSHSLLWMVCSPHMDPYVSCHD